MWLYFFLQQKRVFAKVLPFVLYYTVSKIICCACVKENWAYLKFYFGYLLIGFTLSVLTFFRVTVQFKYHDYDILYYFNTKPVFWGLCVKITVYTIFINFYAQFLLYKLIDLPINVWKHYFNFIIFFRPLLRALKRYLLYLFCVVCALVI